jgi:hypothetical protein
MEAIAAFANSRNPASEMLYKLRHSAEDVIRQDLGIIFSQYQNAKSRYDSLTHQARIKLHEQKPWIFAEERGSGSVEMRHYPRSYQMGSKDGGHDTIQAPNSNLQDAFNHNNLSGGFHDPEQFAIAEVLLKNQISPAILLTLGGMHFAHNLGVVTGNDAHDTGTVPDTIASTGSYFFLMTMINELIDSIGPDLFKETVIHVWSDFHRNMRNDGAGSDHGWEGNVISAFSGAIRGLNVVGNMHTRDPSGLGTWGRSAPLHTTDGMKAEMKLQHAATSLCHLLRVESPCANFHSVLSPRSGNDDAYMVITERSKLV